MNNIKEALESAIEVIHKNTHLRDKEATDAINACKAALAEVEASSTSKNSNVLLDKCELVKGVIISEGSPTLLSDKYIKATDIRLYTSPPQQQWVGLTYDQKMDLKENNDWYNFPSDLIEATEAKLKQLNTKG